MKRIIEKLLECLPNKLLLLIENTISSEGHKNHIRTIRIRKFYEKTDLENLDVSCYPICKIKYGDWNYPLFHMYFINNMLANILYCLSNGYRPVVEFINDEGINLWTQFLKQPFEEKFSILNKKESQEKICELKQAPFFLPAFPNEKDVNYYHKLFKNFVVLNDDTEKYFDNEYNNVFPKDKRIIGVLCRGTDYTSNKPKGHPIQPEIGEVIEMVKQKMEEYKCEFIYLATDEEKIKDEFDKIFKNQVLTNKRHYFDKFYKLKTDSGGEDTRISWVHFNRENDSYYKSLEYFSSVNLLSKCNVLIAGSCGGSRMAMYLNNNQYDYCYLFNKGMY